MREFQEITTVEFRDRLDQGNDIFHIDVSTRAEFNSLHVQGAKLYPFQNFKQEELERDFRAQKPKGKEIYILCRSGTRARMVAKILSQMSDIIPIVVDGGTQACAKIGMPLNRSEYIVMSLERQVRIAAGSLVFAGVVLGTLIQPEFYGLSAFVGAGLVFAGLTDTCAMGIVLAKMPWNRG